MEFYVWVFFIWRRGLGMKMVVGPGVPLWVCWVEEVGVIELIDLVQIMGYPPKIVML